VNEELRWAAIEIFANDEFKKSGIEDSMRVVLAFLRRPRYGKTGRTLEMRLASGEVSS
jgi:hypothetical protein